MNNQESLRVLNGFVKAGGTIDIGRVDRFECAAIAADPRTVWVVLIRREGESLLQLLDRLERRLSRCLMHGTTYNELGQRLPGHGPGAVRRPREAAGIPGGCALQA
jgi:hypothetical protein